METLSTWDVWNFSTTGRGAQSVMISGHTLMPKLPASQYNNCYTCMIVCVIMYLHILFVDLEVFLKFTTVFINFFLSWQNVWL